MTIRKADSASWPVRVAFAALLSYGFLVPSIAQSAEAAAATDEEEVDELEAVQVTGTRIQTPGATSANPIESITAEQMRQLGIVNVADALLQLVPQNISTYQPFVTGDEQQEVAGTFGAMDRSSFFIGNTIANLRGLDPTFGTRTLTMVDGRRVVSTSNQADVVDMNIIPSNLLSRMDVVTGGASATYGSGAMAGVVNLVLNNRLTGFNLDMDYGVNEAGDGSSPHISVSGGLPLFGGRGHALVGAEWQKQHAIRDCAAARDWCAESRFMLNNSNGSTQDRSALLAPLPGYEDFPARFQMANVRYSQFAPGGTIYHNSVNNTEGYRFELNPATGLTEVEEYAYGFRGGAGTANVMNGDGPLATSGTTMRPSSERKTIFTNLEFNLTERTTAFLQTNFARTDGLNKNRYTRGTYCVRFDTMGVAAVAGGQAGPGEILYYGPNGATLTNFYTGATIPPFDPPRDPRFNASLRAFLGSPGTGVSPPYWINVTAQSNVDTAITGGYLPPGANADTVPVWNFNNNAVGTWVKVRSGTVIYWHLLSIQMLNAYDDPGSPAVLPQLGRNAYAFLDTLDPEALYQVQRAFSNSITAGGGAASGLDALWGPNACNGYTAVRKVWNPQLEQWTEQQSETARVVSGIRGRFGRDWRWDVAYTWGQTESRSEQNNVATSLRLAMAMDAVIDDRETVDGQPNPNFGKPVCRLVRDGAPLLAYDGRPISDPAGLAALVAGCQPINVFGTQFATAEDAARQQAAIDYAFVESVSSGKNSLQTLSFNTNGTMWEGWGAGPMTGAFGLEVRKDTVDNAGTRGPYYLRADLASSWSDAFGGSTTTSEVFTELNMPLISNVPGINLWSFNVALRYASYRNKGGAGTTGQKATQHTTNWKFQTIFEPFDWVRFRITRSRDLRAAGYRDLFAQQPGIPDQFSGINPWRERTSDSTENQQERWGQVGVGNPLLKPETSNTLTLGLVLSPSGWAQGMRMTADYYNIQVKNGITIPFTAETPITACWEGSGNIAAQYIDGDVDPANPGVNGLFDESLTACREIQFGSNPDGSRNLQDIVAYNSRRPANSLPFQRRGIDLGVNYMFPLSRAFETLPGSLSLTVRATRALESSGVQLAAFPSNIETYYDLTGQIRSSVFIPGVSASPKWTGNIIASYIVGDLTTSLSARYIGGAKLDKTWCDPVQSEAGTCSTYQNEAGEFLNGSVDDNSVAPYMNFALNGSYNLKVADMKQFQIFGSINNLFNKAPPFTGGGISGASAQYHDTMGRAYRVGVRLKF